jgi:beta-fructofuranosidase
MTQRQGRPMLGKSESHLASSQRNKSVFRRPMNRRSFLAGSAATAIAGGNVPRHMSVLPGPQRDVTSVPGEGDVKSADTRDFYYKPRGGRVGDTIPFFSNGQFRIFHLYKADGVRYDTTWHQVSTTDFVHYTELGEAIGAGKTDDQDRSVATGSVIHAGGKYHAFYTGFGNPHLTGRPEQGVMHATSEDLVRWTKIPKDTFYASEAIYGRDDWRDPFVFWNAEAEEFWMLVAARLRHGPSRRRGCTALCKSKNLESWQICAPFWSPGIYYTHECPDLFRMGDWWYLIFSEFSESNQTRYRMSRNISGPWITPNVDTFDTRAFYAGKTATDGKKRFLFGWNPLRAGARDSGDWEWGGNLVVHQLVQEATGELRVALPETIDQHFNRVMPIVPKPALGKTTISGKSVTIDARDSFGIATLGPMSLPCKAAMTVRFEQSCHAFGLLLHLQNDLDTGYYVRFEGLNNRVVFDRWPREHDVPFMPGLERPLMLTPGKTIRVEVIIDLTIAEIYVDGKVAMSTRLYSAQSGQAAVFVENGIATFERIGFYSGDETP